MLEGIKTALNRLMGLVNDTEEIIGDLEKIDRSVDPRSIIVTMRAADTTLRLLKVPDEINRPLSTEHLTSNLVEFMPDAQCAECGRYGIWAELDYSTLRPVTSWCDMCVGREGELRTEVKEI